MIKILLCLLPFLLASCFLFRDYRKKEFSYSRNGQTVVVPLVVPKGYVREERIDTAGMIMQTFHYTGGAVLYAAYLTDTTFEIQPFNKATHQPLLHRLGGLVYKGQTEGLRFFREIRQGNMRFGYREVTLDSEHFFDSSTNHASLQKH